MGKASVSDAGKAGQTVDAQVVAGKQIGFSPAGKGLAGKTVDPGSRHAFGICGLVYGHRNPDRHLVRRTTAACTRELASKVSIVHLHAAIQRLLGIALGRCWHELAEHLPSGTVGLGQLAHKRQLEQPSLVLADQVDGQERSEHRRLGTVHDRLHRERDLATTALALEQSVRFGPPHVVIRPLVAWTSKSVRPAYCTQSRKALIFAAAAVVGVRLEHTSFERCAIRWHGRLRRNDSSLRWGRQAHGVNEAEVHD